LYFDYSLAENSNIGYRYARAEANFDNNVDLSMYTKVELKVRGNNKKYWVGLNSGSVKDYGYHHSASFTSRPEWAIIKVQFRDMIQEKWAKKVAIDLKNISALQVSMSSNQSGESGWLEIEYVKLLP